MIQITEAKESDIAVIQALAKEIWPITFSEILSQTQIEYMMEMMYSTSSLEKQMRDSKPYLLAKNADECLGYLSYELLPSTEILRIHKIYVLPNKQKMGIGRNLINTVQEIAEANNREILSLNVNRYNNALKFYENIGFEVIGREDIEIGEGYLMEDYILEKKI